MILEEPLAKLNYSVDNCFASTNRTLSAVSIELLLAVSVAWLVASSRDFNRLILNLLIIDSVSVF